MQDHFSRTYRLERLDGAVKVADRQASIDRFNKDPSIFLFLLSTRAGGLGVNLQTADTVIIFDSDWNPHSDLQALARAHRIGQRNKVMIYRLVARGTVEERVLQKAKKKLMLEEIVVSRMDKKYSMNKEELEDIVKYGTAKMFVEGAETATTDQIGYTDEALEGLLDRDRHIADKQAQDEAENQGKEGGGWLASFKVAQLAKVESTEGVGAQTVQVEEFEESEEEEDIPGLDFWDDLLCDSYQTTVATVLGKGKRERKQVQPLNVRYIEDEQRAKRAKSSIDVDEEVSVLQTVGKSTRVYGFNLKVLSLPFVYLDLVLELTHALMCRNERALFKTCSGWAYARTHGITSMQTWKDSPVNHSKR